MTISSVILQAMNLCSYLTRVEDMLSQGRGEGIILKTVCFLEKYIYSGDWQCRCIWGRCCYICRIKRGKKQMLYGELVGTTECITL